MTDTAAMTDVLAVESGPEETATPLVQAVHINVDYQTRQGILKSGSVRALDDVSISIMAGETLALVGESGSGKTTLGKVTLRLVPAMKGQVIFDGQDITSVGTHDLRAFRQRAQIVFQDPFSSLNPYMRVRELIEEPLIIDKIASEEERKQRVDEALISVDLTPVARFAAKFPNQMSGGQRQRVGIARALVRDPIYLVADEPVSMIDASSRIEILDMLDREQSARGMAFLFITHDIATARHFTDRIAVMYQGQIIEEGGSGDIIDQPLHPYTQALIAAIPEPDPANRFKRRAVVPGEPSTSGGVVQGCPFTPRCPQRIPGLCDINRPHLLEREPGHRVACWLYEAAPNPAERPG